MANPKLQYGDDAYRIVAGDGTEGELFPYGEAATLDAGGHRFLAFIDIDPDDPKDVVSLLPENEWLEMDGRDVGEVEHEDVEFQVAGEGEGEGQAEAQVEASVEDDDEDLDGDEDEDLDGAYEGVEDDDESDGDGDEEEELQVAGRRQ
jgi:hypothetical protein